MHTSLRVGGLGSIVILSMIASAQAAKPEPLFSPEAEARVVSELAQQNEVFNRSEAEIREAFSYRDAKGRVIELFTESAAAPKIWALKDPLTDRFEGTSTDKANQLLRITQPLKPVVVAVIDSGVDVEHPALKSKILVNQAEARGARGFDDDHNGFVDDVTGWNFLGGKNGQDVTMSSLEVTREVTRLGKKEQLGTLTSEERAALPGIRAEYQSKLAAQQANLRTAIQSMNSYSMALEVLRNAGLRSETLEDVQALPVTSPAVQQSKDLLINFLSRGSNLAALKALVDGAQAKINTHFNLNFNPSSIIGDHPEQLDEIGYGNPHVAATTADHGTHCSGIIAAVRNADGMEGQAKFAQILPVRAVPDGDERDKDIANAVRYAVNQGARVINMSFGKDFSPNKEFVDDAFEYAEQKGVLVIHSAGNDGRDTSDHKNFPNRFLKKNGRELSNWIEVGASSSSRDQKLPASFSNYSKTAVDVFAPGVGIYSTTPGGTYRNMSGTSMAGPEVAGIAALLISQHPNLSPAEVKDIIMKSARRYPGLMVTKPGTNILTSFDSLSISGGVVDAFAALRSLGN